VHSVCQVCRENEAKTHRTCPGKTMCEPCETTRLKQSAKKATKSKRTAGKRKAQRALAQSLVPRSWTVREDGVKTSLCSSCHAGRPHHSFADQVTKCCYFCVTKKRHSAKRVKLQVKAEDDTIPARAASPISGTPLLLSAANASSALLGATASSAADAAHASAPRVDHMSLCGSCNKKIVAHRRQYVHGVLQCGVLRQCMPGCSLGGTPGRLWSKNIHWHRATMSQIYQRYTGRQ
jgi:hypothetical protein